jgi:nucleoside-diphosphate-sugar epimerase
VGTSGALHCSVVPTCLPSPSTMLPPLPEADLDHILSATRPLWEELRGGRIFVTGGTGFFGHWLLESFCHANSRLDLGAELVALTRDPVAFAEKSPHLAGDPAIALAEGDIRTFKFPRGRFSHVIHAATTSGSQVTPLEHLDTIIGGTRRALNFAVTARADRFLLTSSGAVYGRQPEGVTHLPEDFPGAPSLDDPASAYGEGKRVAELLCAIYQRERGLQTAIARCFAFVGPHLPLDAHFAIGNFIRDALFGETIGVHGDGTPQRSYLYAADLAIWLWTILFRGEAGRAYNVGSEENLSIAEVACMAAELHQPPLGVEVARRAAPAALANPARYVPDTTRAETELGLGETFSLAESIERTLTWHQTLP